MLQELAQLNVLLVDDHPAVRFGIRALIADEPDMQLVAEHGSASADTVEVAGWADVAVVDYHLGDRDGLWLAQQIKRRPAAPPVLIYSAFADAPLAVAAIVAGADGLLAKATLSEELSVAIRRLASGHQYFPAIPPSLAAALCARLEPVDQAICSMLIHGVPPAEIGERLDLAPVELDARRGSILHAIAPRTARTRVLDAARAPLDYDRPRRGLRYPAPK
jgi:two-component system, NarL family, response regulator DevR